MINDILKPDYNYTPTINSDTVIPVNHSVLPVESDTPLRYSKHLSEFFSPADKKKVRLNIDTYSTLEVYNKEEINDALNNINLTLGSPETTPNKEGNLFERVNYLLQDVQNISQNVQDVSQDVQTILQDVQNISQEVDYLSKEMIKLACKNLLINSNEKLNGTTHYLIKTYNLNLELLPNEKYTFVLSGTTSENLLFAIFTNNGNALMGVLPKHMLNNEVRYIHITTPSNLASKRIVIIYNYPNPNGQNKPCHIEWATLYKGHIEPPLEWK